VRKLFASLLIPLALLAGCGGSGGGGTTMTPPPPPPPTTATAGPPNVESVVIDGGPTALTIPAINTAFVSVKICVHGTTNCQTVDHIEIDTGSVGLRIVRSNSFTLTLPQQFATDGVTPLAECLQFADGTSWGSLNLADITLPVSTESASNIMVHIIGDASVGSPPAACTGNTENTVETFGANGILGVGPFINDCNSTGSCPSSGTSATYFTCTSATSCSATTMPAANQVPNPVVQFAKHPDGTVDNNGVILELPSVASGGTTNPTGGVLVFGIGTQSNNTQGGVTTLLMDTGGFISASLNGKSFPHSYLDSGSNAVFFTDSSLVVCQPPNNGFYCVGSTSVSDSATLQGTDMTMLMAPFTIDDAVMQFNANASATAFPNLAGPNPADPTSLDLGLSFFYGRNVYTGFETNPSGPYFAY